MANNAREASAPQVAAELSRDLNLFHVTMMGVGMMIGAGVFLGIAECVGVVGPGGALITFALNGVIAMCSAMSYAELCSAVPRAGGAYNSRRTTTRTA
jgi:amino acid permease